MMHTARVLVVDDDHLFTTALADFLRPDGLEVSVAHDCAGAERQLGERCWDVMLLDHHLPDGSGLALVERLSGAQHVPIIVITGHADIGDAVTALRSGVHDYLIKPINLEQLRFAVLRSIEAGRLERKASLEARRRERHHPQSQPPPRSPRFGEVMELAMRAAKTSAPVLLSGETGTGKTMLARRIHRHSAVSGGPFVAVNCGAIPATLVEAELFGTEQGAYTGAQARPGMFELASGGTLFLDEIAELPLSAQATLLAALEQGRIRRVGSQRETPVEVRVVAASNVVLADRVRQGGFRADLLFRLDVLPIELPPLRERLEDLDLLSGELLAELAPSRLLRLAPGELAALSRYHWPGNIRELRNVLERSLLFADDGMLRPSRFLPMATNLPYTPGHHGDEAQPVTLAELERRHILRTLERFGGQRQNAAAALGISTATLRRRLAAYRRDRSN